MDTRQRFLFSFFMIATGILLLTLATEQGQTETITVDDDNGADHTSIQDAIDNSTKGDTIRVYEGSYHENVTINRSLDLIGNGSANTIIDGGGTGDVVTISVDGVNMSGFSIIGSGTAMDDAGVLVSSGYNHIRDINCSGHVNGIILDGQGNTTITRSSLWNNFYGIKITSSNNTISGSTCSGSSYGIYVYASFSGPQISNITVANNTCSSNNYGIYFMKTDRSLITDNTLSSSGNAGIWLMQSSWNTLDNNRCQGSRWYGVFLSGSDNCTVTNSIFSSSDKGIYISGADRTDIHDNEIMENRIGILVMSLSKNNSAHDNLIHSNTDLAMDAGLNSGEPIDARNNWWGSDFGPVHPDNWNGKGDNVSECVNFDPWIGKERVMKFVDAGAAEGGDGAMEMPYNNIQDAIDNIFEGGAIYVWEGNHEAGVLVSKMVHLIGNGSSTTIIDGTGSEIPVSITADWVNMSGFSCINSGNEDGHAGMTIHSDNNHIFNNSCSDNGGNGILLNQTRSNFINDNILSANGRCGVLAENAHHNSLSTNTLDSNNGSGLHFISSEDNDILGNRITRNKDGVVFSGGSPGNLVQYNNIFGNQDHGLDADGSNGNSVLAEDNWWGHASGPFHHEHGMKGKGDNVTDHVDFDSWSDKEWGYLWLVDFNAADGGCGTPCKPYNDIQKAVNAAEDEDIVRVLDGWTHIERGIVVPNSISIIGSGVSRTTLYGYWLDHQYTIELQKDGCTITGFFFNMSMGTHHYGAIGFIDSGNHRIFGNNFSNCNGGIYLSSSSNNEFFNNSFYNNRFYDITAEATQNNNNLIYNNHFNETGGLSFWFSYKNHIFGNHFSNGGSIFFTFDSRNNHVYDNLFESGGSGVIICDASENYIYNNSFVDNWVGVYLRKQNLYTTEWNVIEYNIFTGNRFGVCVDGPSANNTIRYNLIQNNSEYGINATDIQGKYILDARFNWWGDVSGPYHPVDNTGGKGDNVSDNVVFSPWYLRPVARIVAISPDPVIVGETNSITFSGEGTGISNGLRYVWKSDRDEELYNGTDPEFSSAGLSIGTHTISLEVGDIDEKWSRKATTTLVVTKRPVARIDPFLPGLAFDTSALWFNATAVDDGEIMSWVWISNLDGELHNHTTANFSGLLSQGNHIISLRVRDDHGLWSGEKTFPITIYGEPSAVIDTITPDPALINETVYFAGHGTDDGTIEEYHWSSSLDGFLGNESSFITSHLSKGTHTILFWVKHDYGVWSHEVSETLVVHERPVAVIDTASPGLANEGTKIHFSGHGYDDGAITGYSWRSDKDGHLSSEHTFTTSSLAAGTHTIYFSVQDDQGEWSESSETTIVVKGRPLAAILSVSSNAVLSGETVHLSGTGDDTVVRYSWSSTLDGEFYNGTESEIEYDGLSNGTHTIRFRTMNAEGVWSRENTAQVMVNGIPQATIGSITPNPALGTDPVRLSGEGSDDGTILRYRWHSSIEGVLYEGNEQEFEHPGLSIGDHVIFLQVMDELGVWSTKDTTTLQVREYVPPNSRPTVLSVSLANNTTVSGIVIISGTASDPDGIITKVEVSMNGGPWQPASGTNSWKFEWDTNDLDAYGSYAIQVRTFDGTDHSDIVTRNVTVESQTSETGDENEGDHGVLYALLIVQVVVLALVAVARLSGVYFNCEHVFRTVRKTTGDETKFDYSKRRHYGSVYQENVDCTDPEGKP